MRPLLAWFLGAMLVAGLVTGVPLPGSADGGTPVVVLGGEGVVSQEVSDFLGTCVGGEVLREAGANRYATAAAISSWAFPSADTVFVATGENFPDALAAGPWAGSVGGPILLVGTSWIPPETRAELDRLHPSRTVILGGTGAVSAQVEADLNAGPYGTVERVSGIDRYATAAAISLASGLTGDRVYVATGLNFPDALAGAGPGAVNDAPILLVAKDSIPAATVTELKRLGPTEIVILGGTGVVSEETAAALSGYTPTVRRLAGASRYGTAAAVSADTYAAAPPAIYVATGDNYPDALAGAGPAGYTTGYLNGPTLLVGTDRIPSETGAEIQRLTGYSCPPFNAQQGDFGFRLMGFRDDVQAASIPGDQTAILHIEITGTGNSILWALDQNLQNIDLLVNEIGAYEGTRPVNTDLWSDPLRYLDVTATGAWRIDVRSLNFAPLLATSIGGTSDDVIRVTKGGIATFTYAGTSNFIVWAHGNGTSDLLVNTIGNFSGTEVIPASAEYLEIEGIGSWTITYK